MTEVICEDIQGMAWAPGPALPRSTGVVGASGAVTVATGQAIHVFPIDAWWVDPAPPATPRQAVSSSGFDDVARRLGLEIAYDADTVAGLAESDLLVERPLSSRTADRSRRASIGVALMLAVVLLPVPLVLTVFARGWSDGLVAIGWSCAAASAAAFCNVLHGVLGRRERTLGPAGTTVRPVTGPSWFLRHARVAAVDGVLALTDGRWRTMLLATPQTTGSVSAVVRARTVRGNDARVLLIDGTDVVRAELPLRHWPEPDITELLASLAIIRDPSRDRRSSADIRFDTNRGAGLPGLSLVAWTSLGVAPVVPLALTTVLQLMVSVFARIGGPTTLAVALVFAGASAALLVVVIASELVRRLPWDPSDPPGFRPSRDFASVVVWFLALAGLAVFLVLVGESGAAWYAAGLAVASAPFRWCLYRHRAVQSRRGVLDFFTWLRSGCRPYAQQEKGR
uniref:Uncharacterized protein n=1 Tax=Neobacillus citreus TaxID=2833578 RepID=A0A942SWE3_9BACI